MTATPGEDSAVAALAATGVQYTVTRHGRWTASRPRPRPAGSSRGSIIKTLVVRRGDDDFLLVLVPGDRGISWPKLRALLGVSRLSMPDAETARAATGYERGTITPFGAHRDWPVVADDRISTHGRRLDRRRCPWRGLHVDRPRPDPGARGPCRATCSAPTSPTPSECQSQRGRPPALGLTWDGGALTPRAWGPARRAPRPPCRPGRSPRRRAG